MGGGGRCRLCRLEVLLLFCWWVELGETCRCFVVGLMGLESIRKGGFWFSGSCGMQAVAKTSVSPQV